MNRIHGFFYQKQTKSFVNNKTTLTFASPFEKMGNGICLRESG
jgi:hypothetical protein